MGLPAFTFSSRARPFLELGLGDSRVPTGQARWDVARWDTAGAKWAGTEPTWLDVTCEAFSAEWEYGRPRTTDRFVAGSLNVVLDNASGWADPEATADPAALSMRPGRAIRVGVDHAVHGRLVLFRGFIDAIRPTYAPADYDRVTLQCIDALGEVNRAKLAGQGDVEVGAGDTASQRIARLLTLANWPPTKQDLDTSTIPLVGDPLNGQLADLLGRAADSGAGVVFGDQNGNLCYRPRDWQTYPAEVPPDATIGNVEPGQAGYWIPGTPQVDGWLDPSKGTVSTADAADLTITTDVRVTARVRMTGVETAATWAPVAKFSGAAGGCSYTFLATYAGGFYPCQGFPTGASTPAVAASTTTRTAMGLTPPGTDRYIGATVRGVTPGVSALTLVTRALSSPDGVTWTQVGNASAAARGDALSYDSAVPLVVGAVTATRWPGLIYWVQLEKLDAAGNPAGVIWRWDANDYPGTGTSYVDPRGRTWTLSAAGAITPKVPAVPDVWVPPVPADVCPTEWVRPFDRADIATRAIYGRDVETAVVVDDVEGQTVYGIEPFERTDLWTRESTDLTLLANRALRVRSWDTAPLVRGVSLNAATEDGALDLMATANPYLPSRYRCRLQLDRGLVFDAQYLVTGVVHVMTPDSWACQLQLDSAAPYAAVGGRWDRDRWDRATWAVAV